MPRIGRWTLVPVLLLLSGAATTLAAQEAEAEAEAEADAEAMEMSQDEADADHTAAEEAALEAAHEWLALVDAGEHEESWYESGTALKDAVTPEQWTAALAQARGPMEPFGDRELLGAEYTTEIPNAPAGEYVVIRFRTQVANDATVTEVVVPMKQGGAWKVSGYFVQPD